MQMASVHSTTSRSGRNSGYHPKHNGSYTFRDQQQVNLEGIFHLSGSLSHSKSIVLEDHKSSTFHAEHS